MSAFHTPSCTSGASSPLAPSSESLPADEVPAKTRRREKVLRGIERISSLPSIRSPVRSDRTSSSGPYKHRATLSCVSVTSAPPVGHRISGFFTPGYASAGSDEEYFPEIGPSIPRYGSALCSTPASANLPPSWIATRSATGPVRKSLGQCWVELPREVCLGVLSTLPPRDLVRTSRTSKEFYNLCFDGQLWTRFNASDFHTVIPVDSLAKIIAMAGPFIQDLNLRGFLDSHYEKTGHALVERCNNMANLSLEGCRHFPTNTLHDIIRGNTKLTRLNLTTSEAVTNEACQLISQHCPHLEVLNVSWCKKMDARGIRTVVRGCPKLRDVRAGEIKGFNNLSVAQSIFETNNLERLVLSGCLELTDEALKAIIHGRNPKIDVLTEQPMVACRKLRHLDVSRCNQLTDSGVMALSGLVPSLEGLQLNCCTKLTDASLAPILQSTPNLTHLELEELKDLTDNLFSEVLAKAPCAPRLRHLSVSYCERIGDPGMVPIMKACTNLRSVEMDNTRIGNLVLVEAAEMVRARENAIAIPSSPKVKVGLSLVVYDCALLSWAGVREVFSVNTEKRKRVGAYASPTEIISLKCYYNWQPAVDQHTARVLRGDFASAERLACKWVDYMWAVDEAGAPGAHVRRRRRRAREAQHVILLEQGLPEGRRRARTIADSCAVM